MIAHERFCFGSRTITSAIKRMMVVAWPGWNMPERSEILAGLGLFVTQVCTFCKGSSDTGTYSGKDTRICLSLENRFVVQIYKRKLK